MSERPDGNGKGKGHIPWVGWTDEEILVEVHKLRAHGFGTLTIEAVEHKVREVVPALRLRKPAPLHPELKRDGR